jgi:hypothetical protein
MKQLIQLVESAEQLDEINFKKAAATAMAVGSLAGAPQDAKASDDAVAQGIDGNQPVATQVAEPQGKVLHGKFIAGMSIEDVEKLAPGGKFKEEYKEFRGVQGGTVKYKIKGAPGDNRGRTSTFFAFDNNNNLSAIHFVYQVNNNKAGPFAAAAKGEGLFGRKWQEVGYWFKQAYNLIPADLKSTPNGKAQSSRGGEFGLGIGGVTSSGKGVAVGLDKVGSAEIRLPTADGQVVMTMRTQKGVVNNFHIMGMTITKVASNYDSPFDIQ